MTPIEIIRLFHRVTGIALIFLVGIKLVSGFTLAGFPFPMDDRLASWFHYSRWVDFPLLFSFLLHAALGVLRIWIGRIRHKWAAFGVASGIGVILFLGFLLVIL